jgi:hypothetical protein
MSEIGLVAPPARHQDANAWNATASADNVLFLQQSAKKMTARTHA